MNRYVVRALPILTICALSAGRPSEAPLGPVPAQQNTAEILKKDQEALVGSWVIAISPAALE